MAIYQNINGVWTLCQRPYVNRNGVWTACESAWVKRSGTWVQAYEYDVTPPDPPQISLEVVEDFNTIKGVKTLATRYIKVGVRLPNAVNDPDARLTRVLTDYNNKAPTTQFGGTFTSASDASYPTEPWSEWRYNDYGPHNDTSVYKYKQWPRNASAGTIIKSDETFFFTGWSLDNSGNWSVATPASIHTAKASVDMKNIVTKETRIQPNSSGSWRSAGWQGGKLIQQKSPRSVGLWNYGNQISDSFGAAATTTIKSAQIYIKRENDTGTANAHMYLFWNSYGTVAGLPNTGQQITKNEITQVTPMLAKGQGAWYDLPTAWLNNLNNGIKSIGLDWKAPDKADAFPNDYSSVVGVSQNLRCGELHITWEEEH